ncbi:phage tail tube protein [Isoptericola sp. NPDC055881]
MVDIPSTPFDGNMAVWLVPAIANPAAPTVAEITAGVDISCYLTPDGYAPTADQATITDDRLCSRETYGQPGRKTRGLTLTGIDNTNSVHETEFNELVDTLVEGTEMYVVRRRGLPYETAIAASQKVSVLPIKPGMKQDVAPEANSVTRSTWPTFVTGQGHDDVEVVAGA